jgi:hypothetical protein
LDRDEEAVDLSSALDEQQGFSAQPETTLATGSARLVPLSASRMKSRTSSKGTGTTT